MRAHEAVAWVLESVCVCKFTCHTVCVHKLVIELNRTSFYTLVPLIAHFEGTCCRLYAFPFGFWHNKTNKNLRCGNRKGLLGRNDQTHHRMGPKTMESIPPSKRNTQADIQLRTRQTNHQQETDGCIQIKHNPEHQPSRMSSKSTAYVPPKTASTPTKANTQTCSYLDFNQFLIRRITRNICLRLRIKQIQILTCREQDILIIREHTPH